MVCVRLGFCTYAQSSRYTAFLSPSCRRCRELGLTGLLLKNKNGLLSVPLRPFAFRLLHCVASLCHLSGKPFVSEPSKTFMFFIRDLCMRIIYGESAGIENREYIKHSILNGICHLFKGLTSLCILLCDDDALVL
jgi:hypothetical protein